MEKNPELHMRVLDAERHQDLFQKAAEEYHFDGLPYLRVYGKDRQFIGEMLATEHSYDFYGKDRQTVVERLLYDNLETDPALWVPRIIRAIEKVVAVGSVPSPASGK